MIVRVQKRRRFTVIDNDVLEDERLSFRTLGVLAYLLSRPDNWEAQYRHLSGRRSEGQFVIREALKELERYGYLERRREQRDAGRFEWVTTIYEEPSERVPEPAAEERPEEPQVTPCGGSRGVAGRGVAGRVRDGRGVDDRAITKTDATSTDEQEVRSPEAPAPDDAATPSPPLVLLSSEEVAEVDARPTFEDFWRVWPQKVGRQEAAKAWAKLAKAGVDPATVMAGAEAVAKAWHGVMTEGTDRERYDAKQYLRHAATWLNAAGWEDELQYVAAFRSAAARLQGAAPPMNRQEQAANLGAEVEAKLRAEAMRGRMRQTHSDTLQVAEPAQERHR